MQRVIKWCPGVSPGVCAPQIIAHDDAPTYLLGKIWKQKKHFQHQKWPQTTAL